MASLECQETVKSMSPPNELLNGLNLVGEAVARPAAAPDRFACLISSQGAYGIEDYAKKEGPFSQSWRRRITEWLYQVADAYHLSRETVGIAMNFLDRYLSTTTCNKKFFQLASMCALFLAAKMQEARPVQMYDLIKLSRGVFKNTDLKSMEKAMLRHLKWHLHPPTPPSFVRIFLQYLPRDEGDEDRIITSILELSEWNCELSVCEYYFINFKPSVVAISSILNAFDRSHTPPSGENVKKFVKSVNEVLHFPTESAEIQKCRDALMRMYDASGIEEDLKNDSEVAAVNAETEKVKTEEKRVVSPTSVTDSINPTQTPTPPTNTNDDESCDEMEDDEVSKINANYMKGNAGGSNSRPVSRSGRTSAMSCGRLSAMSDGGGPTSSMSMNSTPNTGDVKITMSGMASSNFKVTVRSRPNSVCSGAIISTESSVTAAGGTPGEGRRPRLKSGQAARDRRSSFDINTIHGRAGKVARESLARSSPQLSRSVSTDIASAISKTTITEIDEFVEENTPRKREHRRTAPASSVSHKDMLSNSF
ncbi:hypothetical protein TrLO_g9055 [Triparma laevis f. longispina]|uniref:Cyclin N-terminal domain-containing protein n=1 Tax=Triparma laevis f. longispina TaxID=1714387 RepID=A0A9W7FS34_9STRA|nr:hypothetical protein TrLO_g9055 [Triparma laevis f. longispina]